MSNSIFDENAFNFLGESFDLQTPIPTFLLQRAARESRDANLRHARALHNAALQRVVAIERASWNKHDAKPDFRAQQEEKWKAFLSEDARACVVAMQPLFPYTKS